MISDNAVSVSDSSACELKMTGDEPSVSEVTPGPSTSAAVSPSAAPASASTSASGIASNGSGAFAFAAKKPRRMSAVELAVWGAGAIAPISDVTIQRIVSGQAITDLSSAVKELVDNALDAEARTINIRLFTQSSSSLADGGSGISGGGIAAGIDLIEVSDDGTGVPLPSRPHLAARHATSKLRTFHDLYRDDDEDPSSATAPASIYRNRHGKQLGFRGEALYSLANTSRSLVIATRCDDEELGQKLVFLPDGSLDLSQTEFLPRKVGTTVAVMKLFDRLPVRRTDFVRRIRAQRAKMIRMLQGYAIFGVGIGFNLTDITGGGDDGGTYKSATKLCTAKGSRRLEDTISSVLGVKFLSGMVRIHTIDLSRILKHGHKYEDTKCEAEQESSGEDHADLDDKVKNHEHEDSELKSKASERYWVRGLVSCAHTNSSPSSKVARELHFFSLNGRPVELPSLSRTLNEVWRRNFETVPGYNPKKRPACVLELRLPNSSFDVNLRPDKREVLLIKEDIVCDALQKALSKVWGTGKCEGSFVQNEVENLSQACEKCPEKGGRNAALDTARNGLTSTFGADSTTPIERTTPSIGGYAAETATAAAMGRISGSEQRTRRRGSLLTSTTMTSYYQPVTPQDPASETLHLEQQQERQKDPKSNPQAIGVNSSSTAALSPQTQTRHMDGAVMTAVQDRHRRLLQAAANLGLTPTNTKPEPQAAKGWQADVLHAQQQDQKGEGHPRVQDADGVKIEEEEEDDTDADLGNISSKDMNDMMRKKMRRRNAFIYDPNRVGVRNADEGKGKGAGEDEYNNPRVKKAFPKEKHLEGVVSEKASLPQDLRMAVGLQSSNGDMPALIAAASASTASTLPSSRPMASVCRGVETAGSRHGKLVTRPPASITPRQQEMKAKNDEKNISSTVLHSGDESKKTTKAQRLSVAGLERFALGSSPDTPNLTQGTSANGSEIENEENETTSNLSRECNGASSISSKGGGEEESASQETLLDAGNSRGRKRARSGLERATTDPSPIDKNIVIKEGSAAAQPRVVWDSFTGTEDVMRQYKAARLMDSSRQKQLKHAQHEKRKRRSSNDAAECQGSSPESVSESVGVDAEDSETKERCDGISAKKPNGKRKNSSSSSPGPSVARPDNRKREVVTLTKEDFLDMEIIGQFNLGFILAKTRGGQHLFILDQHACDEKFNFERFCRTTVMHEQRLIAPLPLELSPSEETCILDNMDVFEKNGFRFRYDEDKPPRHRLALTAVPHSGSGADGKKAVQFGKEDVAALCAMLGAEGGSSSSSVGAAGCGIGADGSGSFGNNAVRRYAGHGGLSLTQTKIEDEEGNDDVGGTKQGKTLPTADIVRLPKAVAMLASRACRHSIMIGTPLSQKEMEAVVRKMHDVDQPWDCPHGRPTMRHVTDLIDSLMEDEMTTAKHVAQPSLSVLSQEDDDNCSDSDRDDGNF